MPGCGPADGITRQMVKSYNQISRRSDDAPQLQQCITIAIEPLEYGHASWPDSHIRLFARTGSDIRLLVKQSAKAFSRSLPVDGMPRNA